MSLDPTLSCPHCGKEIKLNESLAAPMVEATRKEFEEKMAQQAASVRDKEEEIRKERESIDERVSAKVIAAREEIAVTEAKKAKLVLAADIKQKSAEIDELQEVLKQRDTKLAEAQAVQAEAIRKGRELDDAKREMQLTIDKSISDGLQSARVSATTEVEQRMQLKVREKEETITSMQLKIEELRKKAEQGSQQMQGEVQELQLEELLRGQFPLDKIDPVPKGVHGGDAMQLVVSATGRECGTILWESKNTKTWSHGWLSKLRDDQRAAKADMAIIVSQTMPKDVEAFEMIEGVWVVNVAVAMPVAAMLRQSLFDVTLARTASEGMQTKAEQIYTYLTGPQFKSRVGAIVEAFTMMATDLEKEKKAITKQWSKREQQISRLMTATAGMSGDLQGIAGGELEEIEGLSMKALAS